MYQIKLVQHFDKPWLDVRQIVTNDRAKRAAEFFVLVEHQNLPFARIDICSKYQFGPFDSVILWQRFVVLGCDGNVHFIDPASGNRNSFECEGYFAGLYPNDKFILVASACELFCVDANANVRWRNSSLGIDGVVVNRVENGVVYGEGEWNPPGGWRKFQLSMVDGCALALE